MSFSRLGPKSKFPDEIWLSIASHLSTVEQGVLGMVSTRHHRIFKNKLHRIRKSKWEVVLDFRSRIEGDLPQHVLCPFCTRVRRYMVPHFDRTYYFLDCRRYGKADDQHPEELYTIKLCSDREISWGAVQLVMRAHHRGPAFGALLNDLARSGTSLSKAIEPEKNLWRTRTLHAVIAEGKLIVRVMEEYCMPSVRGCVKPKGRQQRRFERSCQHCDGPDPEARLCRHTTRGGKDSVTQAITNIVNNIDEQPGVYKKKLEPMAFRCLDCPQSTTWNKSLCLVKGPPSE